MKHVPEYSYATCCVNSTAEKINAMTGEAREVSYATIARHCAGLDDWMKGMGYDTGHERGGLRMKDDFAVYYFKSRYDGHPCYYISHSCIEYIWTADALALFTIATHSAKGYPTGTVTSNTVTAVIAAAQEKMPWLPRSVLRRMMTAQTQKG